MALYIILITRHSNDEKEETMTNWSIFICCAQQRSWDVDKKQ